MLQGTFSLWCDVTCSMKPFHRCKVRCKSQGKLPENRVETPRMAAAPPDEKAAFFIVGVWFEDETPVRDCAPSHHATHRHRLQSGHLMLLRHYSSRLLMPGAVELPSCGCKKTEGRTGPHHVRGEWDAGGEGLGSQARAGGPYLSRVVSGAWV